MTPDRELLQRYVQQGDEGAFAEVVRRQADLVYSVALRLARDPPIAQDVTQAVFTKLASQARGLCHYDTLVGWLHTTTRHSAIDAIRGEVRRRAREQEASLMNAPATTPEINWEAISPLLDEAVGSLREDDRKAVLLRFFQNRSHQEIGVELGLTENSANKRIERALQKLREYFSRRGVTTTAAMLAAAIQVNSVQAAPAGLAEKSARVSLAGATTASLAGPVVSIFVCMNNKFKVILVVVLALLAGYFTVKWPKAGEAAPDIATTSKPRAPDTGAPPGVRPVVKAPEPDSARVVMPVLMATPPPAVAAMPAAATSPSDPRVEVGTAMTDFVNLLESGDYVTAADTYLQLTPDVSAAQLIVTMQKNPDFPNTVQMMINATMAAQTTVPDYNEAGDLATYKLIQPTNGKTMVRWKKINGRWFVDAFE